MNTARTDIDVAKIAKELHEHEAGGASESEMANAYELVRANAEVGGYSDELELAIQRMTYAKALASYRTLLVGNPGKALKIGDENAALIVDDHLCAAPLLAHPEGMVLGKAFDFDELGWDSDNDCWDNDMSTSATTFYIAHPKFLPLVCP